MTTAQAPRLSVVMPVYNGETFLRETILGVLNQTRSDFEFIAVDDGSSDRSREILAAFPEIRVLTQANAGQSAARNLGIENARTELIALIDQDDCWYPTKIAQQLSVMEARPHIGLHYCDMDTIDDQGRIIERQIIAANGLHHPKRTLVDCLSQDMFIVPSGVMLRRSLFSEAGGFDPALSGYEDDDLFLRMFPLTGFEFCPDALAQWRIHDSSASRSLRMDRSRNIYFAKLLDRFPDNPQRRLYYRDDVIVPRFYRTYLTQFAEARWRGEREKSERLRRDLFAAVGPHLGWTCWIATWLVTRQARWSAWLFESLRRLPRSLLRLAGVR